MEKLEYLLIFICFVMMLQIKSDLKQLKRSIHTKQRPKNAETEGEMSRLIEELKGKWCEIDCDDLPVDKVLVCDVDEDWVRVQYNEPGSKKETKKLKEMLIRVTSIDSVEILER